MRKNKKGFTLVELVIVIAVIAILASVLIPTFAGILERAKENANFQRATTARDEYYSGNEKIASISEINSFIIEVNGSYYEIEDNGKLSLIPQNLIEETMVSYEPVHQTLNGATIYKQIEVSESGIIPTAEDSLPAGVLMADDNEYRSFEYVDANPVNNFQRLRVTGKFITYLSGWFDEIVVPGTYIGVDQSEEFSMDHGQNTSLTKLVLQSGVKVINYSFSGLMNVETISIPQTIKYVGGYSFSELAEREDFGLPDVEPFNFNVWENGRYLGNSVNPYQVLVGIIDKNATSFVIHEDCTLIADHSITYNPSFRQNMPNMNVTTYDDCIYFGTESNPYKFLVTADNRTKNSYTIHPDCKQICDDAFYNITSLTSINIPEGVYTIGYEAFSNCSNLAAITLPSTLEVIGNRAFNGVDVSAVVEFPDSLIYIGQYAFYSNTNIDHLIVPANLESVARAAFYVSKAHILVLEEGIESLDEYSTFTNSDIIYLPKSLKQLDVESLGYQYSPTNLNATIYYGGTQEEFDEIVLKNVRNWGDIPDKATLFQNCTILYNQNINTVISMFNND